MDVLRLQMDSRLIVELEHALYRAKDRKQRKSITRELRALKAAARGRAAEVQRRMRGGR